jgi:glycine C-acetyltransferase
MQASVAKDTRSGNLLFPESMLEFSAANYWLKSLADATERNIYPYQPPFSQRKGNHVVANGRPYLLVSAYDYLGLLGDPEINRAAIEAIENYGTGTSGVRLLTGTLDLHLLLEQALARFTGKEAAITFSSGYAANLSFLSTLLTPEDHVFADQFIHRSLVEGLQLSGCKLTYFKHNDPNHLETLLSAPRKSKRNFIVSEGVFSMEGDMCCLKELVTLRNRYHSFLILDEAHSLGMLGHGICAYNHIDPAEVDIITGSLSKAIPAQGGFVAGSKQLISYLQHTAATYIFSSALNPPSILAAHKALELIQAQPQRSETALNKASQLRKKLHQAGFSTGTSSSAIVPVFLGNQENCLRVTAKLREMEILASPILFPAVPRNQTRLRVCTSVHFEESQMEALTHALVSAAKT